jgi:spore maturation protein CgeB
VFDDTAGPTLPYGAINSRVFDALAAGALVVTDNEDGSRELFDGALPVARDAAQLEGHLRWVEENPAAAAELQATLRSVVLERHTYAHRAAEIRDHLLAWVDADRYAILIGVPDWDQAS